ncbi:MAG: hypothetical protein IKM40_04790 [Clostridia bacterium]|nr:hypothetical protein [Clostridia bacterium]
MLKRKELLLIFIILVAIVAVVVGCTIHLPIASAAEYMKLSKASRIEYAKESYSEFSSNPDKEYEILISFNKANYKEIADLLSGQDNIISAFHCFEANGECAVGGYVECKGKTAEKVIEDYFSSIYNLVVGQIETYDDFVAELKKSYEVENGSISDNSTNDSYDTYGKEVDTSPIEITGEGKEPCMTLEDELRDAEHSLEQFLLQKEAMDNGDFYIYGIRLLMTGAEIEKILSDENVLLVEILNFDNNNLIVPIR